MWNVKCTVWSIKCKLSSVERGDSLECQVSRVESVDLECGTAAHFQV